MSYHPNPEKDILTFKTRSEKEVIKVQNCTFANDVKAISTFYFCSCSKEDFYPICEACAKICHAEHNPSLNIRGIYICKCGEYNHEITENNLRTFQERKNKKSNFCFYRKFMNICPNEGFYEYDNKTFCAVCMDYCIDLSDNEKKNLDDYKIPYKQTLVCQCPKHFEPNVVNLNLDFNSKPKFHLHFQNINFNILSKIPFTRDKYLNYLYQKIKEYMECSTARQKRESQKFFSDFITYKILECFSIFAQRWENKFFHIYDFFKDFDKNKLVQLLSLNENVADINEAIRGDFFNAKFYFAELLFNYFIRTYLLKYNNLWNIRTIINMNLFQRYLYQYNIKNFFKFHCNEENAFNESLINNLIYAILELYDAILKFTDSDNAGNLSDLLYSYYFPTFTRIFKYMIKSHLLSHEQLSKYFELVFDSVKMWNEKLKKDNVKEEENVPNEGINQNLINEFIEMSSYRKKDTSLDESKDTIEDEDIMKKIEEKPHDESFKLKSTYYIMKSILYSLIYCNDSVCINYFKGNYDKSKDTFVFIKNPFIEQISKVFMIIINTYYRKEDLSRVVIYDFYVRKIMEILIQKDNNFYVKSLENLDKISPIKLYCISTNEFLESIKTNLMNSYSEHFNSFTEQMGIINRQYFDFDISFEKYVTNVMEIFTKFQSFINKDISYLPDIKLKYFNFIDLNDKTILNKLTNLQNAAQCSLYFQKVEEFIHIYAKGKGFKNEEFIFELDEKKVNYLLKNILNFYFLLIIKNPENFCLVMNIKPDIFIETFVEVYEELFYFFERMVEMVFDLDYKFDNYYFISECLCFVITHIQNYFTSTVLRDKKNDIIKLNLLGKVFKFAKKLICTITIYQNDFINLIDRIQNFVEKVNYEDNFSDIPKIFESYFTKNVKDEKIGETLNHYFQYLCELIINDFNFFLITSNKNLYLFKIDTILENLENYITEKSLPISLEYALLRYYFTSKIGIFFTTNTRNPLLRLFKSIEEGSDIGKHRRSVFTFRSPREEKKSPENKIETKISNVALVNLAINEKIKSGEEYEKIIRNNIDQMNIISKFLNKIQIEFPNKIDEIIANRIKLFGSHFEMIIFLYKYFENIILRPTHKLFNFFLLNYEGITGIDCEIYYNILFLLLKDIIYLYLKITQIRASAMNEKETTPRGTHYKNCFEKNEILEYENITLIKELSFIDFDYIMDDLKEIKLHTKYYHIGNLYKILIKNIDRILYMKPKTLETIKTKTKTNLSSKEKKVNIPIYIYKKEKIIKKYHKKMEKTYDLELSLFNALELSEKEMELDLGKEILYYLLTKMSDGLTDENFYYLTKNINEYKIGTLGGISIKDFKLQNCYPLVFLNQLFYNYSQNFQSDLSETIGENFNKIFSFLVKDLIFSCNLNENVKLYSLDRIQDFDNETGESKKSICNELCILSIKFLQNMCESHNKIFQNRFFNFKFEVDTFDYILDNNEYPEEEIVSTKRTKRERKKSVKKEAISSKRSLSKFNEMHQKIPKLIEYSEEDSSRSINDEKKEEEKEDEKKEEKEDENEEDENEINTNKKPDKPLLKLLPIPNIKDENEIIIKKSNRKKVDEKKIEQEKKEEKKDENGEKKIAMHSIFQKIIQKKKGQKVHFNIEEMKKKNEEVDAEAESENRNYLLEKKYSFFNFIMNNMRLIIENIHVDNIIDSEILKENQNIKSTSGIIDIYQHFTDLIVEMIQGTQVSNFDNFYRKLTDSNQLLNNMDEVNNKTLDSFTFLELCMEFSQSLFRCNFIFDNELVEVSLTIFTIIVNIISQELKDDSLLQMLIIIFPPIKILAIVSEYLKGITIKHILKFEYDEPMFEEQISTFEFDNTKYEQLKNYFKEHLDIYEDKYFKIAGQMYLFLTILGKKYHLPEAEKVIRYSDKDLIDRQNKLDALISGNMNELKGGLKELKGGLKNIGGELNNLGGGIKDGLDKIGKIGDLNTKIKKLSSIGGKFIQDQISSNRYISGVINKATEGFNIASESLAHGVENLKSIKSHVKKLGIIKGNITMKSSPTDMKNEMNNFIITSKFFNKFIKTCEFMIENDNKMILKTIYFITDPRSYFISKTNIDKFFEDVDRSSSTTKLKSFIDILNEFMYEVNFKYNAFKENEDLKWMFEIDYKKIDFFNFCWSLAINFMLLFFLDRKYSSINFVHVLTLLMAGFQIIVNIIYISIFINSKYKFYVILSKSQYEKKELELLDYIQIYILDSLLFNNEVSLMILIIIMGLIGIISESASFLFTLQLLTVVKFVATIKEIVLAFQLRIGQLVSLLFLLFIFLFFLANIGYNFFPEEFEVELSENVTGNICSTLLECAITYFNQGVRSGGGIGDLLPPREFETGMYWVRFFNDLIFFIAVILMLLNMINGVIVSTFSQIREESNAKDEDINNKCFICNIDRVVFERLKIQFKEHTKNEHNVKTYIRFLTYLKLINEKDLDSDQSYIIEEIKKREIKCFPVNNSLATGEVTEDNDEGDEGED